MLGIVAIVAAVALQSFSAVWIKRLGDGVGGFATTTGGLLVSLPLFLLSWWILDGTMPQQVEPKAAWSILYLGIFGSVIGFMLYFSLVHEWPANRVALITLVTPVMALLLGLGLNDEHIGFFEWLGAGVILLALASYVYGDQFARRVRQQEPGPGKHGGLRQHGIGQWVRRTGQGSRHVAQLALNPSPRAPRRQIRV